MSKPRAGGAAAASVVCRAVAASTLLAVIFSQTGRSREGGHQPQSRSAARGAVPPRERGATAHAARRRAPAAERIPSGAPQFLWYPVWLRALSQKYNVSPISRSLGEQHHLESGAQPRMRLGGAHQLQNALLAISVALKCAKPSHLVQPKVLPGGQLHMRGWAAHTSCITRRWRCVFELFLGTADPGTANASGRLSTSD